MAFLSSLVPFTNLTPSMTWARYFDPSNFLQLFSAHRHSLKTMVSTVSLERHPLVLLVRSLTVAKVDSMGLLVRMCLQCSAGKS